MVRLRLEGKSFAEISRLTGYSLTTVMRWMRAFRKGGWEALRVKSCRPHTPYPLTTPEPQEAHPGWGARLIRRQLLLEGVKGVTSEFTIHKILKASGFPPVRRR